LQSLDLISYIFYEARSSFCESKSLLLSKKNLILLFKLNLISLTINIRLLVSQMYIYFNIYFAKFELIHCYASTSHEDIKESYAIEEICRRF